MRYHAKVKLLGNIRRAILLLLCAIALVIACFLGYNWFVTHAGSVDFGEYEPQVLPPGVHILSKSVEVWLDNNGGLTHHKLFRIELSGSAGYSSYTSESKADQTNNTYECGDGLAINQSCVVAQTPHGQQYLLITTYGDDHTTFEQDASFVRGNTDITVAIQGNPAPQYSRTIWNGVIDSFVRVHYGRIVVDQVKPGP